MNYELAKELKEAGFPQGLDDHSSGKWICSDGTPNDHKGGCGDDVPEYYFPILPELIEAVGEELALLINAGKWWFAQGFGNAKEPPPNFIGKTPKEAVAKLWLALNK